MNFLINRQIEKKGGKLIALFVDLKAAFDSVDRRELIKTMKKIGVRERLIKRIEELLRETKSRVRMGGRVRVNFGRRGGVRQGCSLSR